MAATPRFLSLSAQAAVALKAGIEEGKWKEFLPSERRLCEFYQVSRPTIRAALHRLAKDGLISIRQGCRNRINTGGRKRAKSKRLVAIVTHEPVLLLPATAYHGITEMRSHLADQGFVTEVLVVPAGGGAAQRRKLEDFLRQNRILCCLLISVSREVQQWFATRKIGALVLGSCHASVQLPSLDVDYRSVCRHAGGIFIGKGHRRIAFFVPQLEAAGDLASEDGFLEAAAQRDPRDGIQAIIVRHNGTPQNIAHKLDDLFGSPHPPTALLVAKTPQVLMVLISLLKRGLAVPDTVSIIARDQDSLFSNVSPPISHYSFRGTSYEHRLTRLMLQMLQQGHLPPIAHLIFPQFVPGGTVKDLRQSALQRTNQRSP